MTLRVELRPQAERDLKRLEKFLLKLSAGASQRRLNWLRAEIAMLAERPARGRLALSPAQYELILRYGRSRYLLRYRVTPSAVIIIRIFHGKERRPIW